MIVLLLSLMFAGGVFGCVLLVAHGMRQRRERLELALEPTCLLCDSRNLELGVPPEYRCRDCGFDTHKTGALTTELARFRELSYAVDELQLALRALDEATRANQIGRIPAAAEPLARALDHLRDVVLDELELLETPHPRATREDVARLTEYIRLVRIIRDDMKYDILGQMSADGAVQHPMKLDFEHVVAKDYEKL